MTALTFPATIQAFHLGGGVWGKFYILRHSDLQALRAASPNAILPSAWRAQCPGGGARVPAEMRNRTISTRFSCPSCGRRLAARTSPHRRNKKLYYRVPPHYQGVPS